MSKEDLEKFKEIMAAPVFTDIVRLHGSYDSRPLGFFGLSGAKEDPDRAGHPLIITCDRCGATNLFHVVRCYTNFELDLCLNCYGELREAATDPAVLQHATKVWRAAVEHAGRLGIENCIAQLKHVLDPVATEPPDRDSNRRFSVDKLSDELLAEEKQPPKRKRVAEQPTKKGTNDKTRKSKT